MPRRGSRPPTGPWTLRWLRPGDAGRLAQLQSLFATAFADPETYASAPPGAAYHNRLLANPSFFALVALRGGQVVGGLTGYELAKPEQVRTELYLYDLAVAVAHRRQGLATALLRELQAFAAKRGAAGVFVQAHPEDRPAVRLYAKFGARHRVLHFDLPPRSAPVKRRGTKSSPVAKSVR